MKKTSNSRPIFVTMPNTTPIDHSAPLISIGDLVYLTADGHDWMSRTQKFGKAGITLIGRTAVVHDIYDWESDRGKKVIENRAQTGKWVGLDSLDFRYVLLVLFPELKQGSKVGLGLPDVMPYYHPRKEGKNPLFLPYPKHLADLLLNLRKP